MIHFFWCDQKQIFYFSLYKKNAKYQFYLLRDRMYWRVFINKDYFFTCNLHCPSGGFASKNMTEFVLTFHSTELWLFELLWFIPVPTNFGTQSFGNQKHFGSLLHWHPHSFHEFLIYFCLFYPDSCTLSPSRSLKAVAWYSPEYNLSSSPGKASVTVIGQICFL